MGTLILSPEVGGGRKASSGAEADSGAPGLKRGGDPSAAQGPRRKFKLSRHPRASRVSFLPTRGDEGPSESTVGQSGTGSGCPGLGPGRVDPFRRSEGSGGSGAHVRGRSRRGRGARGRLRLRAGTGRASFRENNQN